MERTTGIEPAMASLEGWSSTVERRPQTERAAGIEPATDFSSGMGSRCHTTWRCPQKLNDLTVPKKLMMSGTEMDKMPDTPRVCEACGGKEHADCHWCTDGLQSPVQRSKWKSFRAKMRAMSGTYALFQSLVEDVIDRLEQNNSEYGRELAAEGHLHLTKWLEGDPDSDVREKQAKDLLRFHRRAMALLSR